MDPDHRLRLSPSPRRGAPAFFLDRDGTLIEDPGYLADPAGVRLLPGVAGILQSFAGTGHALVVVTNQSGIGRGLYGWDDYEAVSARFREVLAAEGVVLDAECACGHAGTACGWRKPSPGMILAASEALGIDLSRSLLAGDKLTDIEAAGAARLPRAVHVATGQGRRERAKVATADLPLRIDLVESLAELAA